ncbi:MAG: 30S ribosomal protein S16 [Chloroflexi bacterium]|nr:30S ribosomal protein S16 [Chloroflexota bacterium]
MVRIRLRRVGARGQPSYRVVAADKESPRDGRFLETLGTYNPRTEPATINLNEARIFHWLKNGAQPSDSVLQIMKTAGAWQRWERFKQGEELDKLLEEAAAAKVDVDPRTRRDDLRQVQKPKKKSEKAEPAPDMDAAEAEPVAEESEATPDEDAAKDEPVADESEAAHDEDVAKDEHVADESEAAPDEDGAKRESEEPSGEDPDDAAGSESSEDEETETGGESSAAGDEEKANNSAAEEN